MEPNLAEKASLSALIFLIVYLLVTTLRLLGPVGEAFLVLATDADSALRIFINFPYIFSLCSVNCLSLTSFAREVEATSVSLNLW